MNTVLAAAAAERRLEAVQPALVSRNVGNLPDFRQADISLMPEHWFLRNVAGRAASAVP